jgi:hypothetical protein
VNRDHDIEIEVPEVELSIDTTGVGEPYSERYERPSDDIVRRAVEDLVSDHYDELVDRCACLHRETCEELRADLRADRIESDRYYEGRAYG